MSRWISRKRSKVLQFWGLRLGAALLLFVVGGSLAFLLSRRPSENLGGRGGSHPVPEQAEDYDRAPASTSGEFLPPADTLEGVLARHRNATGGWERQRALRSMIVTGFISYPEMEQRIPFTMVKQAPDRMRLTLYSSRGRHTLGTDGVTVWAVSGEPPDERPIAINPEVAATFLRDARFLSRLVEPEESGLIFALVGAEKVGNHFCHIVSARTRQGAVFHHYLDKARYLERRVELVQAADGTVPEQRMVTYPSDFRSVNGLVVPFQSKVWMGDRVVQEIEVETVSFDQGVLSHIFLQPVAPRNGTSESEPPP